MEEGDIVGPYELERSLGQGGMGEVWLATHTALRRTVALKVMRADVVVEPTDFVRFQREMRLHASLVHDNLVRVLDGGQHDGVPYLAMEFIPGGSLSRLATSGELIEVIRVLGIVAGISAGVAYLHEQGILHRDLKPANVLLDELDVPKVSDFGLSRSAQSTVLTRPGHLVGSPWYLTPQVVAGAEPSPTDDVFAIGVISFELLTGGLPYSTRDLATVLREILAGKRASLRERLPDVDPSVEELVESCLSPDPAGRPSAGELVQAARARADRMRRTARLVSRSVPGRLSVSTPVARTRPFVTSITIAVLVVVTLLVAALWPGEDDGLARPSPAPPSPVASTIAPHPAGSILAGYRSRISNTRTLLEWASPGVPEALRDQVIRGHASESRTPDPRTRRALFLYIPARAPGSGAIRFEAETPPPRVVRVNGTALEADPAGTWPLDGTHLWPGMNVLEVDHDRPVDAPPRCTLTLPGPPDLESPSEALPPPPAAVLKTFPEIASEGSNLDHQATLSRAIAAARQAGDVPALQYFIAERRLMIAAFQLQTRPAQTVMMFGESATSASAGTTESARSEELIVHSLGDIQRSLTRFPRSPHLWSSLARALGLAGLESMAYQCQRFAVLLAPDDSWSWSGSSRLIEDRFPVERPSRDRIREALETIRVAERLDPRPSYRQTIERLTRILSSH